MQSYRRHKQQHLINRVIMGMLLGIDTRQGVKMRSDAIEHAYQRHSASHSHERLPQTGDTHRLDSRHQQAYDSRRQHHASAKSQQQVVGFVWYPTQPETYHRAKQR